MSVLIVTRSDDNPSVAAVADHVRDLGHRAVRLDTDLFPTEVRLALHEDDAGQRMLLTPPGGEAVDLTAVTAIYYRRFNPGARIPAALDPQLRAPSMEESRRTLLGLMASLDAFRLDPYDTVKHAMNKQLQLKLARRAGLAVPRTLITNDPAAVRAFAAECPRGMVTKMMGSFAVYDAEGREQVVFTSPVGEDDLADLSGLDLCPMTFQERVEKRLELRVTVVGHRLFTAAIDPTVSPGTAVDWRREGAARVADWEPFELPAEVAGKLLAVCTALGLEYGALDVILTPEGRYVFLEVNPSGEYFWLEETPGFPISRAIAEVLVDPAARRVP
ncbi:MAG TPA: MvdD family ATP-grasp ribosomal peptide maturase [Thermoanaerobaculia bacterium]